jgi:hypothetical protein
MKVKNAVIHTSKPAIEEMLKTDLPVRVAWQFALLSGELAKSFEAFQSTKDGLIRKYGEANGSNVSIDQSNPNWNEFATAINELLDQEVEVTFDKIVLPQRVNGKELEIKPEILLALVDFVSVGD